MELIKKLKIITLIFFITFLCGCTNTNKWEVSLPNNYEIRRINNTTVVLGKLVEEKFVTEIDGIKIGIEEYVSKFSYSNNYIAAMCIIPTDDKIDIKYYIVDSKNSNLYGPYDSEETYNKVKEKIVDENLGEWIDTIEKPQ